MRRRMLALVEVAGVGLIAAALWSWFGVEAAAVAAGVVTVVAVEVRG